MVMLDLLSGAPAGLGENWSTFQSEGTSGLIFRIGQTILQPSSAQLAVLTPPTQLRKPSPLQQIEPLSLS